MNVSSICQVRRGPTDTERLDWWGNQTDFWTVRKSQKGKWTGHELWGPGPKSTAQAYRSFATLREAIDYAMQSDPITEQGRQS